MLFSRNKWVTVLLCVICLLISLIPQTSVAATPLDDDTMFVEQVYLDFLNRAPDADGLAYWVSQLEAGTLDRSELVEQFLLSAEFGQKVSPVARLYFAYFNRIPDYDGLMYWVGEFGQGAPLGDISDAFAGSAEFTSTYGSLNNQAFVNLVYQNVLGRAPDAGGLAYWLGELDADRITRGQVMTGFSESVEYQNMMYNKVYVTMTYIGLLRRAPEQDGFYFWVGAMDGGASGLGLIDGFLNSGEYADRFTIFAPAYQITAANIQYRIYENAAQPRYAVWLSMTKDDAAIQEADVVDIRLYNSAPSLFLPTNSGFDASSYMFLNCMVELCSQSGPYTEGGFWGIYFTALPADTYSFEVDTAYGQTLKRAVSYPGLLKLPIVTSDTMQSAWVENDLVLSWTNPAGTMSWSDVNQLRILLFDGTGKVVLYVRLSPSAETVTINENLLTEAAGLGDGILSEWRVQTRAYDTNNMNFARGYSNRVPIVAP